MTKTSICSLTLMFTLVLLTSAVFAADWPRWGKDNTNNMVAPNAKALPTTWDSGKKDDDGKIIAGSTKNIKWVAKLGSQSYGNVTVAGGKVFVGTNNDAPRDKRFKNDHSLM